MADVSEEEKDNNVEQSDSELSSSSDEPRLDDGHDGKPNTSLTNGHHDAKLAPNGHTVSNSMEITKTGDQDEEMNDVSEPTEPSFGDLLRTAHPDVIDISTAFGERDDMNKAVLSKTSIKTIQAPPANSLGTVLSQALRTNDKELLESCLQTKDLDTIRSTIQRLPSPLIGTLMQSLAQRIHKRPGRAGSLMVWVQWSIITHGGYLATQPQVVKKLRSLRQVIRDRASSLQSLIVLKGKLDMLNAQVELRRGTRTGAADDSDDNGDGVIYVEGEDEYISSSDDDGAQASNKIRKMLGTLPKKTKLISDKMDGDIAIMNGIDDDADMEAVVASDDDGDDDFDDVADGVEGLIDDEAMESEDDESLSSDQDESDEESVDEAIEQESGTSDSDDDEEVDVPVTKRSQMSKRPTARQR